MMKTRNLTALPGALLALAVAATVPIPLQAATIDSWNTSNVQVGATPPEGETGASVVYDRALGAGGTVPAGAVTNGRIVFTPPEAISPGIEVDSTSYPDSGRPPAGADRLVLDGCILTSSPTSSCTTGFQSGKRIKQEMTGFGPMDLVFDVAESDAASVFQVFGRLINVTGRALEGFKVELGFGIGDGFVAAQDGDGLFFSTLFTAQPSGSGPSNSQFPFGLFGDADDSPNFILDGFFDDERTGFEIFQSLTSLESLDYYGNYGTLFGSWVDQASVPQGLFWDADGNDATEALLMAWQRPDGAWELRRDEGETCEAGDPTDCTPGVTRDEALVGSFDQIVAALGIDRSFLDVGAIEDLANLNLNYAISLGDAVRFSSFTLRTTVVPADVSVIPLPAGAPLLLGGLAVLAALRRRRAAAPAR